MKKTIAYFFIIIVSIIIQKSIFPIFGAYFVLPNLVLMLILALSILENFYTFLYKSVFAGMLYDIFLYQQVGIYAIIFPMVVYFVSFFSRRISVDLKITGIFMFGFFIIFVTLMSDFLFFIISYYGMDGLDFFVKIIKNPLLLVYKIFFNSMFFILYYNIIKRIKNSYFFI